MDVFFPKKTEVYCHLEVERKLPTCPLWHLAIIEIWFANSLKFPANIKVNVSSAI